MNILIAEDEEHSRAELRYLLEKLEPDCLISEAADGLETVKKVDLERPEVLFLDINMPGKSGLWVAAQVLKQAFAPVLVFATAYDEHALKAFELSALDYLLKPYRESRLAMTLTRVREALSQQEKRLEHHNSLKNYLLEHTPPAVKKLWAARGEGSGVLLDYADILWFEADDKRVILQNQLGERLQVRYTMSDLEERLLQHGFFRSHKSYLINLEHVREIEPWFSGAFVIRMSNNLTVPLSRRYARILKEQLGWF